MNIGIKTVLIAALAVCILSLFAAAAAIFFARRTVVRFTDEIAAAIDCCMRGGDAESALYRGYSGRQDAEPSYCAV